MQARGQLLASFLRSCPPRSLRQGLIQLSWRDSEPQEHTCFYLPRAKTINMRHHNWLCMWIWGVEDVFSCLHSKYATNYARHLTDHGLLAFFKNGLFPDYGNSMQLPRLWLSPTISLLIPSNGAASLQNLFFSHNTGEPELSVLFTLISIHTKRKIRVLFIWDSSNSWLQRSWPILSLFETLHEFRKHTDVLKFPGEVVSSQILLIILLINSTITVII